MSYIRLEKDADGIVELIFDQQGKSVNVMGDEYAEAMPGLLDELEAQKDDYYRRLCAQWQAGAVFCRW